MTFNQQDCQFGYRQSIFKATAKDRYVITAVYFRLNKPPHQTNIAYGALENALGDKTPTIQKVAQAVMDIRAAKLPDPQHIGNCGSFFKNPVVPVAQFKELQYRYPALPHYTVDSNQVKIPAAWLIDTLGFKGYREVTPACINTNPWFWSITVKPRGKTFTPWRKKSKKPFGNALKSP